MKTLKIIIDVTQHVGKVWISRENKNTRGHLGLSQPIFVHGPESCEKLSFSFALSFGGPMAAIQPGWSNGCNISVAIRITRVSS